MVDYCDLFVGIAEDDIVMQCPNTTGLVKSHRHYSLSIDLM